MIDLDDVGPGDPVDDPAVLLGHLEYRAIATSDPMIALGLRQHIRNLRGHFGAIHGHKALDLTTAAVLMGLATGPFRAQVTEWRRITDAVITEAVDRSVSPWGP